MYDTKITKEFEAMYGISVKGYDSYRVYDNGDIRVTKEEVWEQDENLRYVKVSEEEVIILTKDSISGNYRVTELV